MEDFNMYTVVNVYFIACEMYLYLSNMVTVFQKNLPDISNFPKKKKSL